MPLKCDENAYNRKEGYANFIKVCAIKTNLKSVNYTVKYTHITPMIDHCILKDIAVFTYLVYTSVFVVS